MKKFIPKAEQFFFAPTIEKIRTISTTRGNGNVILANQVNKEVYNTPNLILYWCEYSDNTVVKSYPVRILNGPEFKMDFEPYYHNQLETSFVLASTDVIKDSMREINLLYTYKRPEQVAEDLVIVPENAMEFLIKHILS